MTTEEFLRRVSLHMAWQPVASRPDRSADAFHYLYTLTNPARPDKPMTGFYTKGLAHCVLVRALPSMGVGQPNLLLARGGRPRGGDFPLKRPMYNREREVYSRVVTMAQLDTFCRLMEFNYEPIPPTVQEVVESLRMDMGYLGEYDNMWDFIDNGGFSTSREGGMAWATLAVEQDQLKELLGPADYHVFINEVEEW